MLGHMDYATGDGLNIESVGILFFHIFQRGRSTTNQKIHWLIVYSRDFCYLISWDYLMGVLNGIQWEFMVT